jgi:hypothetical protein
MDELVNNTFRAQCNCGQLVVSFTQAPVAQLVCHCRDCQIVSGLPYAKAAFFRAEEQCAKGEFLAVDMTGLLGVAADKLLPPFEFKPMAHVWTCEKAPEVEIPAGVFQFPKAPPFRPGKQ